MYWLIFSSTAVATCLLIVCSHHQLSLIHCVSTSSMSFFQKFSSEMVGSYTTPIIAGRSAVDMQHRISNSTIPLIHIEKNRGVWLSGFDTLCSSHYQYLEGFITPVPMSTCVNGVNAHWEGNYSCRRTFLAISVCVCLRVVSHWC